MKDAYGREIDYMRISVTDRCNLRCRYCMPQGIEAVPMEQILTFEEICQVASCGASLGIRYLKVTGGEPLVRRGCCELIAMLKSIDGIEKVTLTTNGILLPRYLDELLAAGIDGINVSLDTTDPKSYADITGYDGAAEVLSAIRQAADRGIPVKINAVLLTKEQQHWQELVALAKEQKVDVRFIEMMPIGYGKGVKAGSNEELLQELKETYEVLPDARQHGYGPAVYYRIPGFLGSIGFISAIHGKFCDHCNRIRLSSQGYLKSCLCYDKGADLRSIVRSGQALKEVQQSLRGQMAQAIGAKPAAHCFEAPEQITEQQDMFRIGG